MYLAFGISSLIFSIISIFIPVQGIYLVGLSGFFAWISIEKGLPFGAAAVIINLVNLFLLLPVHISKFNLETIFKSVSDFQHHRTWSTVFFIQIAALIIFISNFLIDKLSTKFEKRSKKYKYDLLKTSNIYIFLFIIFLSLSLITIKTKLYHSSNISNIANNKLENTSAKDQKIKPNAPNKEYKFYDNQVEETKNELLKEKPKFEVELLSGKIMQVDTVTINSNSATLKTEGLEFSINKDDIKSVRKIATNR